VLLQIALGDGKFIEGKWNEGGLGDGFLPSEDLRIAQLEARLTTIEAAFGRLAGRGAAAAEPFIGSELRPDLSKSALAAEQDNSQLQHQMRQGSAQAKRLYDSKQKD